MKFDPKETIINPIRDFKGDTYDFHEILSERSSQGGLVTKAKIDMQRLHRILYEWRLYKETRKVTEIAILELFDKGGPKCAFHVKEIKDYLHNKKFGRMPFRKSNARIYQALAKLKGEERLKRVEGGIYRRNW